MTVRRVLMTADAVGGVWSYALALAEALAPSGVRTMIAVMGPAPSDLQRADAARVGVELREGPFALEWMQDPWADVERAGAWLLELERAWRPDVVHIDGYAHAALPFRAPVVLVAHSCVCSWWRACRGGDAPAEWDRYRSAVRSGLAAASAIVAPSRAMLDALFTHYDPDRAHADRARVIPNAVDPARFRTGPKMPIVFAAARVWDEAKNVAALDAVAADVPWPVVIAGDDLAPDGTKVALRESISVGALPPSRVADWMARAAVYALPARYEPFGLSVLEAALSECALVLGDIPSLRENWSDVAVFVPPGDSNALRDALLDLTNDDRARVRSGRRARARALELASPPRLAAQYLDVYLATARETIPGDASRCA